MSDIPNDFTGVIKFSAGWCGPCKSMTPIAKAVGEKLNIQIIEIDVDDHRDVADQYGVRSVPYFVAMQGGKGIKAMVGSTSEANFEQWVKDNVLKSTTQDS